MQKPHPVLVNAGTLPAAIEFSAREVDICFATLSSPASIAKHVAIKQTALAEYGRDVGLFASALVVCRDTRAEADRNYELILEHGDSEAAANMMRVLGMESQSYGDRWASVQRRFVAGYGTHPLIGTPEANRGPAAGLLAARD